MNGVPMPSLPEGFRLITRLQRGEVHVELIDYRDHSLEAFRKNEYVPADSRRETQLRAYGIHVADIACGTSRRKVRRAARKLAGLAWLAASSSITSAGPVAEPHEGSPERRTRT